VYVTVLLPYFKAKPSSETKSPNHIQRLSNIGTPVYTVSVPWLLDYPAFPVSAAQRTAMCSRSMALANRSMPLERHLQMLSIASPKARQWYLSAEDSLAPNLQDLPAATSQALSLHLAPPIRRQHQNRWQTKTLVPQQDQAFQLRLLSSLLLHLLQQ
jgi:hypothetical protein